MNETLGTLVNVSNSKTKEFNEACEKAKALQENLIKDAWNKIYGYLCSIRDLGFRGSVEVDNLYLYWLNSDEDRNRKSTFYFYDDYIEIYENSCGSRLDLKFSKAEDYNLNNTDFNYCVKRLVSKWSDIKPKLEEVLQKTLTERMSKAELKKQSVEKMNELLANFEV